MFFGINPFELSPAATTELANRALDERHLSDRAALVYESGWRHLEAAQWMTEFTLRGNQGLSQPDLIASLYEAGMGEIKRSAVQSDNQHDYHKHLNTLMAHRALRWFCVDRLHGGHSVRNLADTMLSAVDQSLRLRHERIQEELSSHRISRKRRITIEGGYGHLFEAMTLGLVAEDAAFRNARIIGLPASPRVEASTEEIPVPPDILLWQIAENGTAKPIGGIQTKTYPRAGIHDPKNFTATFVARRNIKNSSPDIIGAWLAGKNLESTHSRLYNSIVRSGNTILMQALGLEAYIPVEKET